MIDHVPGPPDWAVELGAAVQSGFDSVDTRLDAIESNQELQGGTVKDLTNRLTIQGERLDRLEERVSINSLLVASVAEVDARHDAAIVKLTADIQALTDSQVLQLDILRRLDAVAANPMVRRIAYAIGGLLLAYLLGRGRGLL